MKKVIVIASWVVAFAGVIALMGFAAHAHAQRTCSKLNVTIMRKNADLFIKEEDVSKLLEDHGMMPVGKELAEIDIPALEKLLLSHPAVEACEVFITVSGNVNIDIRQRRPVARVINNSGESYYIDDQGKVMPWSDEYTAPVMLVNGNISEGYANLYQHSLAEIPEDSALKTPGMLDDVWQVVKRIDADTFLRAQMVQLYCSPAKGMELIPRVGGQAIVIGDASAIDEKFAKLIIFYREGLNVTGRWNEYSTIDLQYKNQIVCTKKK